MIRMVENDLCQRAVWNWQKDPYLTLFYNKTFYANIKDYNNCFRHEKPTNMKLHSLQETIDFISKNKCLVDDNTENKIIEFWSKHPNGIIDFG